MISKVKNIIALLRRIRITIAPEKVNPALEKAIEEIRSPSRHRVARVVNVRVPSSSMTYNQVRCLILAERDFIADKVEASLEKIGEHLPPLAMRSFEDDIDTVNFMVSARRPPPPIHVGPIPRHAWSKK